ncbi:flagellar hook capping FlgD N-terminal domain-containing protein [Sagittula sp. SSi028]|uniref:flagellar hook capping FlgD N-terminal domain-containing protein n=1 Tax=Sagittula sp. SSi028 TaxID=3400636 RepID=UPI003AF90A06
MLSGINTAATTQTVQQAAAQTQAAETVLSSDFETFLKMLTVQVQNQDPLNPVDSTEYATQLATFSSVEQQVLTNDLLRNLGATLGGNALGEASRWIGMEGLVRAPVAFAGQPVYVRPDYAIGSDRAELVVRTSDGTEAIRYDLSVNEESIVWGGYLDDGSQMPSGIYSFHVESYDGDTLIGTSMAQVYSRIDEVRNDNGTIMVQLSDGTEIRSDEIGGLRSPAV